jgi:hypothetical protein
MIIKCKKESVPKPPQLMSSRMLRAIQGNPYTNRPRYFPGLQSTKLFQTTRRMEVAVPHLEAFPLGEGEQ